MIHKAIIFVSFAILVFPNVYAQQSDYYENSGAPFLLVSDPVICMRTTADHDLTNRLQGYTVAAAEEWSNLLNAGGISGTPKWNIHTIQSTTSDSCNVTIDYVPKSTSSHMQFTITDPYGAVAEYTNHTAKIYIFYDLAPDYQFQWAIKHELGHAFGLGRYIMSDNERTLWLNGDIDAPSIMVPDVPLRGIYKATITQLDATTLKKLYDNNGFNPESSFPPYLPAPTPIPIPMPTPTPPQTHTYLTTNTNSSSQPPIPEFSYLAGMIMAISVIGVVIISRRFTMK